MSDTLKGVTIIIPTFNNPNYLYSAVSSIYATRMYYPMKIVIVNNGQPEVTNPIARSEDVRIIHTGSNLGWEGGLKEGLKHVDTEYVMFANDDIHVHYSQNNWLRRMMSYFSDPKVGAVGPSSNVVMGIQNIFSNVLRGPSVYANFLIGFCVLLRKEALEKSGGVDDTLPGGDDIDLSIRLRDAGYKLIYDRNTFVFHHGFKTGERVYGGPERGGWNSPEMTEKTNLALIRKHGLRKWFETLNGPLEVPSFNQSVDTEGDVIRSLVAEGSVLELGCGHIKTVDRSLGVDFYEKGKLIPTINQISVADIACSVESLDEGLGNRKFKNIVARHILEHTMDPIKAIRHWKSFMEPGGRLFIAVPDNGLIDGIPLNPEHKHAFTKESMATILRLLGFRKIEIYDPENNCSLVASAMVPIESFSLAEMA